MKNLLIIGFVWPEPTSTAAGTRMLQLIKVFQKNDYNITFVSTALKTKNSYNLKQLNIETFDIQLNNISFDLFVKRLNPAFVLFDRYLTEEQFGWRITEQCPHTIKILDTEDLHFLRLARQNAYNKNTALSLGLLNNEISKRELASIYRCDLTLIISKYELKLLRKTFKIDKAILQYVPFLLNKISLKTIASYPSFEERKNFMTIGNFKHEPNWNAVLHLKNQIWPLIKQQLPDAKLLVYGAYTTKRVLQLHNEKEGFLIKGWAKNTCDVFKSAKVCLTPIQFGAGLKGKLIEAMQYGTPSITTSIGAEAMHEKLSWNGFIDDNPEKFSLSAIQLYSDEEIWSNAQKNGVNIINSCFSQEKFSNKLLKKIDSISANISKHRLKNFIGSLLMHHTLKSTKYLAKWIEEKNK